MERGYSTDLSDAEWGRLEIYVPAPNKRGRPRTHNSHDILNAIFYDLKSVCPWRLLQKDFPPWKTVQTTFSWLSQNRRMSKDYERLCASAEAFVYAAMV